MQHPRHPMAPAVPQANEDHQAYFTAEKAKSPKAHAPDLSPLDQMFAYYDAA